MYLQSILIIVAITLAWPGSMDGQVTAGPSAGTAESGQAPTGDVPDTAASDSSSGEGSAWRGYFGVETRLFSQPPAYVGQARNGYSLVAQPEYRYESPSRRHRINATVFLRSSLEPGYLNFDVRELNWQYRRSSWSLLAGMNRVFWGVTESRHVIDIINQSDMRENFAGDVKMGQLMVAATLQRSWGQIEFYALPQFRMRRFPSSNDRPRLQLPISDGEVMGGGPLDWATRISVSRGGVDVHGYYFRGVSREPDLRPVFDGPGAPTALKPVYRHIDQFAGDIQFAHGAWLFKGEAMHRRKSYTQYQAAVGGFEYGISRLFGGASDLALLGEYQFDNRPPTEWPAPATRGVYGGFRLALNDRASSEIRAGTVYDVKSQSWLIRAEFSRRLTNRLGLYFGYYGFVNVGKSPALRDFYRDSHLTISLRRYL